MMKCPRCGFTQPRDQYCAQCGVDISSYKPPQQPLFQRLAKSNLLQLGLVAVVIVLVANYLMKQKDHTLTERVNYLKGNLQISSQKPMTNPPVPPPAVPIEPSGETASLKETASTNMVATKATLPSAADSTAPAPPPASATLTKSVERSTETAAETKTQHTVKISYYEITPRVRELLIEESRSTGQFNSYGDYAAGLLNQFHRRLPSLGKEAVPLHSETKTLNSENFAHWFTGLESATTENHIGFRNNLELTEIGPEAFRINFEIIKSWREVTEGNTTTMVKSSYPLQIEMLKASACFILGVLSPNANTEGDNYISSVPPFTILKSPGFRQRGNQFLILIEIEK